MNSFFKVAFGGSCHWCTEAIFQALKGVQQVEQGWIASNRSEQSYSEGVIVYYDERLIPLKILIEVHLYTHSCTSNHALRKKYRSAIYYFRAQQKTVAQKTLLKLQANFEHKIITEVLPYHSFKLNKEEYQNYYASNPEKPFCQNYIEPKLQLIMKQFSHHIKPKHP